MRCKGVIQIPPTPCVNPIIQLFTHFPCQRVNQHSKGKQLFAFHLIPVMQHKQRRLNHVVHVIFFDSITTLDEWCIDRLSTLLKWTCLPTRLYSFFLDEQLNELHIFSKHILSRFSSCLVLVFHTFFNQIFENIYRYFFTVWPLHRQNQMNIWVQLGQ